MLNDLSLYWRDIMLGRILTLMSLITSIFLFIEPFYCISFLYSFETISNSLMRILRIIGAFIAKDEILDCIVSVLIFLNFIYFIIDFVSFTFRVIIHKHYDFLDVLSKYKIVPKTHHQNTEESLMLCYKLVHTLLDMNTHLALKCEELSSMNSVMAADMKEVEIEFRNIQEIHKKFVLSEKLLDWSNIMNIENTPRLNDNFFYCRKFQSLL